MKNGRMQAKDLDDRQVLSIVGRLAWESYPPWDQHPHLFPHWVMRWELERELGLRTKEECEQYATTGTEKLVLAKCRGLIDRGLLNGCTCGCRGDFELTDKGERFLAEAVPYIGEGEERGSKQ